MLKKNISKNAVKNGRYEWSQPTYLVDKNDKRYESFKQYKKKTGISPDETWNLYGNITQFILPRLKQFKKRINEFGSYPVCYKNKDEWIQQLDKMIQSFKEIEKDKFYKDKKKREQYEKKIKEGLQVFIDNFFDLWW